MPAYAHPRRRRRRSTSIAVVLGGALAALVLKFFGVGAPTSERSSTRAIEQSAKTTNTAKDFDFYVLALSLAPAFCELEPNKKQCKHLQATSNQRTPLTLHGLWPERNQAGKAPEYCAADRLELKQIDSERLRRFMPGVQDGLASHEWKRHGSCSGLGVEQYFANAIDLTERINAAAGNLLNLTMGRSIETASFRAALEQSQPGLSASLTLHCRNLANRSELAGKPVLVEIRACVGKASDGKPGELIECAALDRIDQGCGKAFYVDAP
jgi:ribonuclease T2